MRGTLYAIGEILVFLAIATVLGFILGRLWATWRSSSRSARAGHTETPPIPGPAPPRQPTAAAAQRIEGLENELIAARWQINALSGALIDQDEQLGEDAALRAMAVAENEPTEQPAAAPPDGASSEEPDLEEPSAESSRDAGDDEDGPDSGEEEV